MKKVLIVLGSNSDLPVVENGLKELQSFGVGYTLRIASAHRSPEFLHGIVDEFEGQGGKVFICVAGKSAHLAGVVASMTQKPVLAVPVFSKETAGFDSLLSMCQMPKGIPVGTMGFGNSGFINACLLSTQILGLEDASLSKALVTQRVEMVENVKKSDSENRLDFE